MVEATRDRIRLKKATKVAWIVGGLAIVLSVIGYFLDKEHFFSSYLVAFMLCLGLSIGAAGIWMIHNLVGGRWGDSISRVLLAASMIVPRMAILFIPILFQLELLYPWAREESVQKSHLIQEKVWYLNQFDFILRSILFFVIWLIIAYMMSMQHRKAKGDPSFKLPRTWYGLGIILYVLTITFAAFDWLMSLEPIFYSTIFGLIILVGQLGSAFALSILMVTFFPSLSGFVLSPDRRTIHDLGNFLLMSVMLWAYMSFSQLLLIWSGQLPDEIIFYNYRFYGGWNIFGIILIILHFAIPFFLLLFRKIKQAALASASIAGVLLVSRWMDLVWQVQPNFSPAEISIPWLMIVVPIAFIGIWLASFFTVLDRMTYG